MTLTIILLLSGWVPHSADAATWSQARTQVQQAEQLSNGLWPYFKVSSESQVVYSKAFESQYNNAVNAINKAKATLTSLSNSTEKTNLLKRLDSANATRLYAAHLIDGIKQGEKLMVALSAFNKAIDSGNIQTIDSLYDQYTKQIKHVELHVGRIYGAAARKIVGDKYIRPGKIAQERVIYEVSQLRLIDVIAQHLIDKNATIIDSELAKLSRLNVRAAEIKKAGGYKALPTKVDSDIKQSETKLRADYQSFKDTAGIGQSSVVIGTVTASSLNVRSGPSTDNPVLGKLRLNESVNIRTIEGSWAEIIYGSQTGYIHINYINFGTGNDVGVVQSTELNVRTQPNGTSTQVGRLSKGNYVQIYQEVNGWYLIKYGSLLGFVSKDYIVKGIPNEENALMSKIITVDAGHGDHDPGAVAFGVKEKHIVLNTSIYLQEKLEAAGATVVMTRDDDTFVELTDRAKLANDSKSSIFVSIHANAAGSGAAHGTETFWNAAHYSAESKDLAEKIQKRLIAVLSTRDRGVKEGNFSVLRNTKMPSVLVELGFITNKLEADRLNSAAFQKDAAEAIYLGILDFYQIKQ